MPNDTPLEAVHIYGMVLFVAGVACLAHFIFFYKGTKKIESSREVPGWQLSFPDFFMGLAAIILAVFVVQIFLATLFPPSPETEGRARDLVLYGFATHLTALGAIFLFYKTNRQKFAEPMDSHCIGWGRGFGIALYSFLAVLPILSPLSLGWQFLLEITGLEPEQQEAVMIFAEIDALSLMIFMFVLTIVLAPLSEEILFRGLLYRFIKAKGSIFVALIVSGILFSLLHQNLLAFLPLFVLGVVLAYAYEKSGSIKVPILIHGIFNLNTVIVIVLSGNGA